LYDTVGHKLCNNRPLGTLGPDYCKGASCNWESSLFTSYL